MRRPFGLLFLLDSSRIPPQFEQQTDISPASADLFYIIKFHTGVVSVAIQGGLWLRRRVCPRRCFLSAVFGAVTSTRQEQTGKPKLGGPFTLIGPQKPVVQP